MGGGSEGTLGDIAIPEGICDGYWFVRECIEAAAPVEGIVDGCVDEGGGAW